MTLDPASLGPAVAGLFASGRVVDLILGAMLVEGAILALLWARKRRGVAPLALWVNLGAGACMLLALRAALVGASWVWVWAPLAVALLAHLGDLAVRWRAHDPSGRDRPASDGQALRG